jgi:hypothetical protein
MAKLAWLGMCTMLQAQTALQLAQMQLGLHPWAFVVPPAFLHEHGMGACGDMSSESAASERCHARSPIPSRRVPVTTYTHHLHAIGHRFEGDYFELTTPTVAWNGTEKLFWWVTERVTERQVVQVICPHTYHAHHPAALLCVHQAPSAAGRCSGRQGSTATLLVPAACTI